MCISYGETQPEAREQESLLMWAQWMSLAFGNTEQGRE